MVGLILPILLGYAYGSFLPAYFICKWLTEEDIRTVGDGNPGVTNVARSLGFYPAALTAFYDITKGLLAMATAALVFHSPPGGGVFERGFHHYRPCLSFLSPVQGR
ncbi:MAG: glycerol-3-phosphate acyltransferase [Clostridia bacterium]|nr:glycerol-3-phosphate acyltransferase [Clostridia bacterium]